MIEINTLYSAASVLLGFQVAAMGFRLKAELEKSRHDIMWLNCSDMMNIFGMVITSLTFVAPTLFKCQAFTEACVAVGVILIASFPLSLMGHYDIYPSNTTGHRIPNKDGYLKYVTSQEATCIGFFLSLIICYDIAIASTRGKNDSSAYWFAGLTGSICLCVMPWRSTEEVELGAWNCCLLTVARGFSWMNREAWAVNEKTAGTV